MPIVKTCEYLGKQTSRVINNLRKSARLCTLGGICPLTYTDRQFCPKRKNHVGET